MDNTNHRNNLLDFWVDECVVVVHITEVGSEQGEWFDESKNMEMEGQTGGARYDTRTVPYA